MKDEHNAVSGLYGQTLIHYICKPFATIGSSINRKFIAKTSRVMTIHIDPTAGFCYGVKKAIEKAEEQLSLSELSSLGEIVHNSEEQRRLEKKGLKTISHKDLADLKKRNVLIRAHGEPPSTFEIARRHQVNLVDATCPIVLGIQKKVRKAWVEMSAKGGQVVIYGKSTHPETIGLKGQTEENAIILQTKEDLTLIDFTKPICLFAQTTMNPNEYLVIRNLIRENYIQAGQDPDSLFEVTDSICRHVSNREKLIREFSRTHEVVLFVSGKNSSNGRLLHSYALSENPATHWISSSSEIDPAWFRNVESIGITGATSTPYWLMEEIKRAVEVLDKNHSK